MSKFVSQMGTLPRRSEIEFKERNPRCGFGNTVDERNPVTSVNANKQWFLMVAKWFEMDSVHPQYHSVWPWTLGRG